MQCTVCTLECNGCDPHIAVHNVHIRVHRTFERFQKGSQLVKDRRACALEVPTGNRVISVFVRREMIEQSKLLFAYLWLI